MSKRTDKEDFDKYISEVKESEIDLMENQKKTIKLLTLACGGFFVLAALAGAAIIVMLPLKQSIPYMLREGAGGTVDSLSILTPDAMTRNEAVMDYFIRQYVINRESYSGKNIQTYYDYTLEMSSESEGRAWDKKYFDGANALDKKWGDSVKVTVKIATVIPDLTNNKAVVRFQKTYEYTNREPITEFWSADLSWYLSDDITKVSQRAMNPIGFKVDDYRSSQETSR